MDGFAGSGWRGSVARTTHIGRGTGYGQIGYMIRAGTCRDFQVDGQAVFHWNAGDGTCKAGMGGGRGVLIGWSKET